MDVIVYKIYTEHLQLILIKDYLLLYRGDVHLIGNTIFFFSWKWCVLFFSQKAHSAAWPVRVWTYYFILLFNYSTFLNFLVSLSIHSDAILLWTADTAWPVHKKAVFTLVKPLRGDKLFPSLLSFLFIWVISFFRFLSSCIPIWSLSLLLGTGKFANRLARPVNRTSDNEGLRPSPLNVVIITSSRYWSTIEWTFVLYMYTVMDISNFLRHSRYKTRTCDI